jgi:hypothetical protein
MTDYLGLPTQSISYERLLQIVHESREDSKYLPEEVNGIFDNSSQCHNVSFMCHSTNGYDQFAEDALT